MSFLINLVPSLGGAVSQGLLWGLMVLGVYITYRLLDIADLTVDGSFALGACTCVIMIVNFGADPLFALVVATISGLIAGMITGILHTIFEIPAILAGILTQISLWSVNLGIMGKSNIPLLKSETVFSRFIDFSGVNTNLANLLIGIFIAIWAIISLYWFFGTEIGSALRATGNNEAMIRALGVNTNFAKVLGLMISNALVGLSGGLVAQSQKYADINMGTGAIVIGLAAIVIGEVLMGKFINFIFKFSSAVVGSMVYFLIRAVVLQLGLNANYMKALSAILVFIALAIPVINRKYKLKKEYLKEGKRS
jgi:ABC transporter, permease protein